MVDVIKNQVLVRDDLGMLSVMDVLTERTQITQRELSEETGLHLKKVNYCLHKLLEKGYVKFQRVLHNPDKRGYLYVLTPAGIRAKSRLTYRFLKVSLEFYNRVESKLDQCLDQMEREGVRRLVLFGASEAVKVVVSQVQERGLQIVGILDERYPESEYCDLPVLTLDTMKETGWDGILVTDLAEWDEVEQKLTGLSLPDEKIWRLS
jgi:EPS-associated MarR family transcriptional regulator